MKEEAMEEPHEHTTQDKHNVVAHIDVRGGKTVSAAVLCELTKTLEKVQPGEAVELLTDSFEGLHMDIMAWGRMSGNEVHFLVPRLKEEVLESKKDYSRYIVVKANQKEGFSKESLAIIITNESLEDLLSPLGFALAGACAGMEVSLYFQGPGVRVLRKNFKGRLSGLWKPFSVFARKSMSKMGHAPPAEKLDALQHLGAKVYGCHPSMRVFGVKESSLRDGVILAEYATFLEVMNGATTVLYP